MGANRQMPEQVRQEVLLFVLFQKLKS